MANKNLKRFRDTAALVVIATSLVLGTAISAQADVIGKWRMNSGKITVRLDYCGGKNICATIVGMAKPLNKAGQPKTDKDNPNPSLRSRPIIGLQVVSGMRPDGENQWKGAIYNADDGSTYSATAAMVGNQLTIKACALAGLACKKLRFARVN